MFNIMIFNGLCLMCFVFIDKILGYIINIYGYLFWMKEKTIYICVIKVSNNIKLEEVMAYVITEDCIACGTCVDECPVNAISEGDIYKIDPDTCTDCGTCADACPTEAIHPA